MSPSNLEQFLHDKIPLSKALAIRISSANDTQVILHSPLKPNRNHMGTAFGGSLSAVATLACYTWIFNYLEERGHHVHIILKSSEMKYLAPVDEDFSATCSAPAAADLEKSLKAFEKKGLARLNLSSEISSHGKRLCLFKGEFAVKRA